MKFLALLFLLTGVCQAFLLLPSYDIESPVKNAQVGDRLSLVIRGVKGAKPDAKDLKLDLPPGETKELLDQGWALSPPSISTSSDIGFIAVPLKGGSLTLPMLAISQDGKPFARTQPWTIDVQSAIKKDDPKPQEPAPVKPPSSLDFPVDVLIGVGILGLILLVLVIYGLVRWSRRERVKKAPPSEPPKPEDEVALNSLLALEKSTTLSKGEFKAYYFKTSEILKAYIGARFGFDALEMTTRELKDELARHFSEPHPELDTLLLLLDRVKFTDHVPVGEEAIQIIPEARKFVLVTRRKVIVPAQAYPLPERGDHAV
jgi:hypothetical protein